MGVEGRRRRVLVLHGGGFRRSTTRLVEAGDLDGLAGENNDEGHRVPEPTVKSVTARRLGLTAAHGRVVGVGDQAVPLCLSLHATARRAGAACWLDGRLFEILGGWVASVPEPEVKLAVAAQAAHHGWHATLWAERLPSLHDVDPASWVVPASGVEAAIARLAGADGSVDRLVGVHRVLLPRLSAAHAEHLDACSPVADGPTLRTLRFVLHDERQDQRAGEHLLQRILRSRVDVERAAAHQAVVESLLVEAGPLLG